MDSGRPKRDWSGLGSLIWSALAALVVASISWGVNGQKIERLVEERAEQNLRVSKLEDRLRTVETSRALEQQISALTAEVAALKVQVSGMRDELKPKRGR